MPFSRYIVPMLGVNQNRAQGKSLWHWKGSTIESRYEKPALIAVLVAVHVFQYFSSKFIECTKD